MSTLPLIDRAAAAGEDIAAAIALAADCGSTLPQPGGGRTAERWAVLVALGRTNLTVARVVEAHTDALAILAEAGESPSGQTYGVFAAEAPGQCLRATYGAGEYRLNGTKPWCSLGAELDAALITAHLGDRRQLFEVNLRQPGVVAEGPSTWAARGLRTVTSTSLTLTDVIATPVGDGDWYLTRPGFGWGGIGVAACWFGGALGLRDRLLSGARRPSDQLTELAVGTIDVALYGAECALAQAATLVDAGAATGGAGELLARRTRSVVVDAVERTLTAVAHALGPAPLAFDEDHARRVADLELYIRQHHAERDVAALGAALLADQS